MSYLVQEDMEDGIRYMLEKFDFLSSFRFFSNANSQWSAYM